MKKIMVVDDTEDTLEATRTILELKGYSSRTYSKGTEALKALKDGYTPDLILLDMRMPDLGGPDFCVAVRADKNLKKLKIVFFTASSDLGKTSLKKYGVMGYVFKPFDIDGLDKDIKKYLAKKN